MNVKGFQISSSWHSNFYFISALSEKKKRRMPCASLNVYPVLSLNQKIFPSVVIKILCYQLLKFCIIACSRHFLEKHWNLIMAINFILYGNVTSNHNQTVVCCMKYQRNQQSCHIWRHSVIFRSKLCGVNNFLQVEKYSWRVKLWLQPVWLAQ